MKAKTYKNWLKSGLLLSEFIEPLDKIDEEIYLHLLETVSSKFSSPEFGQCGEPEYKKDGIYYHMTVMQLPNGDYHYLGKLPEFKND